MENQKFNNKDKDNPNSYSNEKVRKYVQEFFEIQEIWDSPKMQKIRDEYQSETLIEKYKCEEKYIDVVQCLNKAGYHTLKRCDIPLEELGKCIFERMHIEKFNKI